MHQKHREAAFRSRMVWISLGWGGAGLVLLATSPLSCRTPALGWSPLFWMVLAPLSVLAGLWLGRPRGA